MEFAISVDNNLADSLPSGSCRAAIKKLLKYLLYVLSFFGFAAVVFHYNFSLTIIIGHKYETNNHQPVIYGTGSSDMMVVKKTIYYNFTESALAYNLRRTEATLAKSKNVDIQMSIPGKLKTYEAALLVLKEGVPEDKQFSDALNKIIGNIEALHKVVENSVALPKKEEGKSPLLISRDNFTHR